MRLITKLEQKFGGYGIHNLTIYIIICYVLGYVLELVQPHMLSYLTLDPGQILRGDASRVCQDNGPAHGEAKAHVPFSVPV